MKYKIILVIIFAIVAWLTTVAFQEVRKAGLVYSKGHIFFQKKELK